MKKSGEMTNFMVALKISISKITGQPVKELEYKLDETTYKQIFTKSRESTLSSPAGINYGHYIAAIEDEILTEVNTNSMQALFIYGFILERWSNLVHYMLQKKRNLTSLNYG